MYLDNRSKSLLHLLIINPSLPSKMLEEKMNLSRRQIKYSIEKINAWLEDNNYPRITRLKNGKFLIPMTLSELAADPKLISKSEYILSEEERILLIFYILLSQDDLSLLHFTDALNVSNVTVLSDMKKAQKQLEAYDLLIVYTRTAGYELSGSEWDKRNLLQQVVQEIYHYYGGIALLHDFTIVPDETIHNISLELAEIETFLDITFTDEKIQLLPYLIGVILRRIDQGNIITFDYQITFKELSDTKEYIATEKLLKNNPDFPEAERLYITLQILSTNIFSKKAKAETNFPQLQETLQEVLKNFEMNAFIKLKNKTHLVERLMLHLKPAYYRIKYNLSTYIKPKLELDKAYLELDHLVKKSLKPLDSFLGTCIPNHERLFITIFIGGHLIGTSQTLPLRRRAVVVCRNGVTISKLLRNSLINLFPEFDFHPTMTMREFQQMPSDQAEVVFSLEPLRTEAEVFIINALLSEKDKWHLRQRVLKRMYGFNLETISVDKIIQIIKQHAQINHEQQLIEDLQQYFVPKVPVQTFPMPAHADFADIVTVDRITLLDSVQDWKESIQIAAEPLLLDNSINPEYVQKMIDLHDFDQPYMILGDEMAIPHAEPDAGVNNLGMSMLIVKNGVHFSKSHNVHFIIVIASTGTEEHITAIHQLSELAMDKRFLKQLKEQSDKQTVLQLLKDYSSLNFDTLKENTHDTQ